MRTVPPLIYRTESNRRRNRDDYSYNHADRAKTFSRPAARFDDDGNPASGTGQALEVRASAALNCRRSLWYAATGYVPTNPPTEESLMAMEAGNALEPVVARAMERAGWRVNPADPRNPQTVTVKVGPKLLVTGHPDGTVRLPLPVNRERAVTMPRCRCSCSKKRKRPHLSTGKKWWWR